MCDGISSYPYNHVTGGLNIPARISIHQPRTPESAPPTTPTAQKEAAAEVSFVIALVAPTFYPT